MLQVSPLFKGDSKEAVLEAIKEFFTHINEWKQKAEQNGTFFDEQMWSLALQLLEIDPQKRLSTQNAREFFKKCMNYV